MAARKEPMTSAERRRKNAERQRQWQNSTAVRAVQRGVLGHVPYGDSPEPTDISVGLQLSDSEPARDDSRKLAFDVNCTDTVGDDTAFPSEATVDGVREDSFIGSDWGEPPGSCPSEQEPAPLSPQSTMPSDEDTASAGRLDRHSATVSVQELGFAPAFEPALARVVSANSLSWASEESFDDLGEDSSRKRTISELSRDASDIGTIRNDDRVEAPRPFIEGLHDSSPSDVSDEDEETAECPRRHRKLAARRLLDSLMEFPGCTQEAHVIGLRAHEVLLPREAEHRGLDVMRDRTIPAVLDSPTWLDQQRCAYQITAEQLHQVHHGQTDRATPPPQVCLHKEPRAGGPARIAYDKDSFLGFARSLGFLRHSLQLVCDPPALRNISADLHLDASHCVAGSSGEDYGRHAVDVHRTAHCFLGLANGSRDVAVFLLFPRLEYRSRKFFAMTEEQQQRFVDRILLPSIMDVLPEYATTDFPGSFQHAKLSSTAKQTENRKVPSRTLGARQLLSTTVQACYLDDLWHAMCHYVDSEPGLSDFGEMQIFFNAKGVKMSHQSTLQEPTLEECFSRFRRYVDNAFDLSMVFEDLFFVDLGREVCPVVHFGQGEREPKQARTLLFRRCCLQSYVKWLYEDAGKGQTTFFQTAMLRDAANLVTRPGRKSMLGRGGVKYIQLYARWKAAYDASTCYPFGDKGLEELALDPRIRASAASQAKARQVHMPTVEKNYIHSKLRSHEGARSTAGKQKGCRMEMRIVWGTLLEMERQSRAKAIQFPTLVREVPSCYWEVYSRRWSQFLWHAANRKAASFEWIRAQYKGRRVPWEATALMAMDLRLLRHQLVSSDLQREGALWWGTRQHPSGKTWQGLGFQQTMEKYGYCWALPIIDWNKLRFQRAHRRTILFGNHVLKERYHSYATAVRPYLDAEERLNDCEQWLKRFQTPSQRKFIVEHMAHVCLKRFREDIFDRIFNENISESIGGKPDYEEVYLCWDSLKDHARLPPYIAGANRSDIKTPAAMISLLFGRDDGPKNHRRRRFWEYRAFRSLYFHAEDLVQALVPEGVTLWTETFQKVLVTHHWLWPQPDFCHGTLIQNAEKRLTGRDVDQPQLWAICKRQGRAAQGDVCGYQWAGYSFSKGGAMHQTGYPPQYPQHLSWTEQKIEEWLVTCGVRRHNS